MRELGRGSLVWTVVSRLGRSMSGRSSWVATRVARHPPTRAFPRTTRIALSSVLFGGVDRWLSIVPEAWRRSVVKELFDRTIGPLEPKQRVRLLGWAVCCAAITHALLGFRTLLDSWRGQLLSVLALVVGLVLMTACAPLAAAWRSRR